LCVAGGWGCAWKEVGLGVLGATGAGGVGVRGVLQAPLLVCPFVCLRDGCTARCPPPLPAGCMCTGSRTCFAGGTPGR
jgi:hypothetical protein